MSFCINCGSEIQDGAKFCANCGAPAGKVVTKSENNDATDQTAPETGVMNPEVQPVIDNQPSYQQTVHKPKFYMSKRSNSGNESKLDKYGKYFGIALLVLSVIAWATHPPIVTIIFSAAIIAGAVFCLNKNFRLKGFTIAAVVLASLCLLYGVSQAVSGESIKTSGNNGIAHSKNSFKGNNGIGDTVKLNGIELKLVKAEINHGSKYNKPESGNIFVICEFEIANNSGEELLVSSFYDFTAYVDEYAVDDSLAAEMESDKRTLTGKLAIDKKLNGIIGFEIPENWEEMEIVYTPDGYDEDMTFTIYNN